MKRIDNTSGNMALVEIVMHTSISRATEIFEDSVINPRFKWYRESLLVSSVITWLLVLVGAAFALFRNAPGLLVLAGLSVLCILLAALTYFEWVKFRKVRSDVTRCLSVIRLGGWRRVEPSLALDSLRFALDLECIEDVERALAEANPSGFIPVKELIYRYIAMVKLNRNKVSE